MATENDHRIELLDDEQRFQIEQSLRDIIEDLGTRPPDISKNEAAEAAEEDTKPSPGPRRPAASIACRPAQFATKLAGLMLAQLLHQQGFAVESAAASSSPAS